MLCHRDKKVKFTHSMTNQLCSAVTSIWTKSEQCLQHLAESLPQRIKVVLNAKKGPTLS